MPHPYALGASARIPVELVEADFEIAFHLVDMADPRALRDAENVFRDIEARLRRMGAPANLPFTPLVDELRRELDLAHPHDDEAAA